MLHQDICWDPKLKDEMLRALGRSQEASRDWKEAKGQGIRWESCQVEAVCQRSVRTVRLCKRKNKSNDERTIADELALTKLLSTIQSTSLDALLARAVSARCWIKPVLQSGGGLGQTSALS